MRNILIYRNHLLPISETFIVEQANALHRFIPNFTGLRRVAKSLEIGRGAILLNENDSLGSRFIERAYKKLQFAPSFHKKLRLVHPLLIHAHFATDGVDAVHLAKLLDIPLIVTLHGHDVTVERNYKVFYKELWKNASTFICVSEFIRRQAIKAGFPEDKLRVHYIGIDTRKFQPVKELTPNQILFVGRLVEKKGCEILLRAFERVQKDFSKAYLVIAGDGPLRDKLQKLATALKVNCEFLGSVSSDKVKDLLRRSSVLCLPSVTASNGDSEGLGMVILEAMAMRVPVVGTSHAGIPEAIEHNVTGLLAAEKDFHQLAANISKFLGDKDFCKDCTESALNSVRQKFDLKLQTAKLEQIYDEVLCALRKA